MTQEPNRHVICFTAENRWTGETFNSQFAGTITGDAATAHRVLENTIAQLTAPLPPGQSRQFDNIRDLRLHSWHEGPIRSWMPAPLGGIPGPDEDPYEITDIPRAWERGR